MRDPLHFALNRSGKRDAISVRAREEFQLVAAIYKRHGAYWDWYVLLSIQLFARCALRSGGSAQGDEELPSVHEIPSVLPRSGDGSLVEFIVNEFEIKEKIAQRSQGRLRELACAGVDARATAGLPSQETKTVSRGPRPGGRRYT
jgi:hypothetical protein